MGVTTGRCSNCGGTLDLTPGAFPQCFVRGDVAWHPACAPIRVRLGLDGHSDPPAARKPPPPPERPVSDNPAAIAALRRRR